MTRVPFSNLKDFYLKNSTEIDSAFKRVASSGWYLLGKELENFEAEYADFCGSKYSIGVANGLQALELILRSLGIGEGDEVILPSHTFIATALAVSQVGARPVFCEISETNLNLDFQDVLRRVTKKTKAVMVVHLYGRAVDIPALKKILPSHLHIIEDNAQAQGAMIGGVVTGSMGVAAGTSFYPGKNIGCMGDGGAITTSNLEIATKLREIRNYGQKEKYVHEVIGINSRLSEVQAVILRIKLKSLKQMNLMRLKIAEQYDKGLSHISDLFLLEEAPSSGHVFHQYVIRSKKRNDLKLYLAESGIETLIHYPTPIHLQKAYKNLGYKIGDFLITEKICNEILSLPIYPEMSEDQVSYVVKKISDFYSNQ